MESGSRDDVRFRFVGSRWSFVGFGEQLFVDFEQKRVQGPGSVRVDLSRFIRLISTHGEFERICQVELLKERMGGLGVILLR